MEFATHAGSPANLNFKSFETGALKF